MAISLEGATLVASEKFVNLDSETRYGSSGWQETWTDDVGRLYRDARREYGRCTGHVFADFGGKTYAVGWVFHKRAEYEGRTRRGETTYLQETWVSFGLQTEDGEVYAFDVKRKRAVPLPGEAPSNRQRGAHSGHERRRRNGPRQPRLGCGPIA